MGREEQRAAMRRMREGLIAELEDLYRQAFDRIGDQQLGEGAVARLTQLLLRSREAAITPLQEEIEAPLITSPAGDPTGGAAGP
ncbi:MULTISPECIES: hercynine metabolism small protein [Aphanothece]|uniref:hercynine metabolism small protein n=1 Tax=Aphanothece TaxID=1121 RepID=UPI0039850278